MSRSTILIGFLLALGFIVSCSHYDEIQKNGLESTAEKNSHEAGQDCMKCHHDPNSGAYDKWWYIAGTAYYSTGSIASSAGEVQLWTGYRATGTMIHKVSIDRSGNFYTEKIFDISNGYFPVIISEGDTFAMNEPVGGDNVHKSCNNCHGHNGDGLSTPPITLR